MDFQLILDLVKGLIPAEPMQIVMWVLAGLGSAVVLATAIVAATPTKEDDGWKEKIYAIPVLGAFLLFLERFSIIGRK